MTHDIKMLQDRFAEYLNAMFYQFRFGPEYMECYDCEEMYSNWKYDGDMSDHYGTWCATGCTRFVLGDEYRDYIIKFQKQGDEVDYGALEVKTYERAVAAGFDDKFAWTAKLMDYHYITDDCDIVIPIYVMEYVDCNYEMVSDDSYNYHYTAFCEQENLDPNSDEARDEWYSTDGDYSSTEAMIEFAFNVWHASLLFKEGFIKFLREERINDLHCGNWGYRGDTLVLTDYAGYGIPESRSDLRL